MNLPPFNLEVIFEQFEREPNMLVLGASDASNLTVQELFDLCGCSVNIPSIRLKYGDVRGELRLREAVAKSYQAEYLATENILITVGASEAIFIAVHILVQPGDRVLVCDPAYQPLASVASAAGALVETYSYLESRHFAPDLESICERLRGSPVKLLILNTPHNPTGQAFSETAMRQLLTVSKEAGTTVLVDEVFHGIWHGSTQPVPSAVTLAPDTVVIGSLSKIYGLSGLRVGWLAGPRSIIDACRRMRHYTTVAPPLIVQDLGAIAVENREKCLMRTRTIVAENYKYVRNWLDKHKHLFEWVEPQAGLVMLVKLKHQDSTDQFARELAKEKKVFLVPCSTTFNMPEGYLRLGLGTDHDVLVQGLQKLEDFIATKV
jgi:aspartate/methionine/tyrosine aminotransferase